MKLFNFVAVCCILSFSACINAIASDEQVSMKDLKFSLFVDSEQKITTQDISSLSFDNQFVEQVDGNFNLGYSSSAFWIRITAQNPEAFNNMFVEVTNSTIDNVGLFYTDKHMNQISVLQGDKLPFSNRKIFHRNNIFKVPHEADLSNGIILRVESQSSLQFKVKLWHHDEFLNNGENGLIIYGGYYGMLLILIVYNLLLFLSLRDSGYLHYVFYILGAALITLSQNGIGFQFIWREMPWFQNLIFSLGPVLYSMTIITFSRNFLNSSKFTPRLHIWLNIFLGLLIVGQFVAIFAEPRQASIMSNLIMMVVFPSILVIGFKCMAQGFKPARYFVLSFLFLIIGSLIWIPSKLGLLPMDSEYIIEFFTAVQMLLLSLAMADRLNGLHMEKEMAQARLLESKTKFLEAASRFVPAELISLMNKESIIEVNLGDSIQRSMTVLFSDIRSFTTINEDMSPDESFEFINSYLEYMEPVITKCGGVIDKFIGDAIMAIFPASAKEAITAGIEMQRALGEFNRIRSAAGKFTIKTGIGIHTGNLMLGTVGVKRRMDSTVISDAVNLASRLEHLTKNYGTPIIVSEQSLMLAGKENFNVRHLGGVIVKGKAKKTEIYEVLDCCSEEEKKMKLSTEKEFTAGLTALRDKDIEVAKKYFEEVLQKNPNDTSAQYYINFCKSYHLHYAEGQFSPDAG